MWGGGERLTETYPPTQEVVASLVMQTDLLIKMFEGTTLSYVWTIMAQRERERERERPTTYRRRHTHRRTVMHTCDDEGKNDLVSEGVRYGQLQADMDTR